MVAGYAQVFGWSDPPFFVSAFYQFVNHKKSNAPIMTGNYYWTAG
jgi:hypothetical protein